MATGDCRFLSATIAGLNPLTLNPVAAGWTQVAYGTLNNFVQDATNVAILENGIMRVVLNSNAAQGLAVYVFNGTAWKFIGVFGNVDTDFPTITAVLANSADSLEVKFNRTDTSTGTVSATAIRLRACMPSFTIVDLSGSTSANVQMSLALNGANSLSGVNTITAMTSSAITDNIGANAAGISTAEGTFLAPRPADGFDLVIASAGSGSNAGGAASYRFSFGRNQGPEEIAAMIGIIQRSYGLGNSGTTLFGRGQYGQIREAEDAHTVVQGTWALYDEAVGSSGRGTVLSSFASPDITPEGLAWDGTNLWVSGDSSNVIYKLNPTTGATISSFAWAAGQPQDIAWDGTNLRIYDANTHLIYVVTTAGSILSSFAAPGAANQDRGMAYFGGNLYVANISDDLIYVIDATTGAAVTNFACPGATTHALWHDGTYLWAADATTDTYYKLDATTGAVIISFPVVSGLTAIMGMTSIDSGATIHVCDDTTNTIARIQKYSSLRATALALDDSVSYSINFPTAGTYYIGVMAKCDAGTPQIDVSVGGTLSGTPVTVPTTGFDVQTAQLKFGPFTVTSGNKTVAVKVTTLSTATILDLDFLAIYGYEATASTPSTSWMPKNLAQSLLRSLQPAV